MRSLPGDGNARWIWPGVCQDMPNQYVFFKHEFVSPVENGEAYLAISVDTVYACWLNGMFLESQQFSDFPNNKKYDLINISKAVRKGTNSLELQVYYQGRNTTRYLKGRGGAIFSIKIGEKVFSSGSGTCWKINQFYKSGDMPLLSPQLSFTFQYDARKLDRPWEKVESVDLIGVSSEDPLELRPVKSQKLGEKVKSKIIAQGVFRRGKENNRTPAQLIQSDYLSAKRYDEYFSGMDADKLLRDSFMNIDFMMPSSGGYSINPELLESNDGAYLIVDLEKEEAGLLDIDIDTEEGAVLDIAYGEHLGDLRVRATFGDEEMNFASRIICSGGRQIFTHYFTRWACRYIQVHISHFKRKCKIHYIGLRPQYYPVEEKGLFRSSDSLHNKIYETSRRTLFLCMHEHYEDCPWREQALYANDSYNQSLAGYFCYGEYDFPFYSFSLLGESLGSDGYLDLTAPSNVYETIPSFTFAWIKAVGDLYLYGAGKDVLCKLYPLVKAIMDSRLSEMRNGLLPDPFGKRYWHFYDWASGLAGLFPDRLERTVADKIQYNALLNLFFALALKSAVKLAEYASDRDSHAAYSRKFDEIKNNFHHKFWDAERCVYHTSEETAHVGLFHELTQAMALLNGFVPHNLEDGLRESLSSKNTMVKTTLSQSLYKFEALLQDREKYGNAVINAISNDWGYMLFNGASSFWETLQGSFGQYGGKSLCHGWSAIPIYFYFSEILGVKPFQPGFGEFLLEPNPLLGDCRGIIPTPFGNIEIDIKKDGKGVICEYKCPQGTKPIFNKDQAQITFIRKTG